MPAKTKSVKTPGGPACPPSVNEAGPCREKYWRELDAVEKIERLRTVMKQLMRRNSDLDNRVHQASKQFDLHLHQADGTILLRRSDRFLSHSPDGEKDHVGNPDDVYF
jgi:hypothetical protein